MRIIKQFKAFVLKDNVAILLWCGSIVIAWRLALEFINEFFIRTLPIDAVIQSPLMRWLAWDGGWYSSIVNKGYFYEAGHQSSVAFFPAFPISVDLLSNLTHINFVVAGLILNLCATIGITFFLYKITRLLFTQKLGNQIDYASKLSVILFLAFPSSLFLGAFYADAFLILGITGAIYFALSGKLWHAAIFAALASGSKSLGLIAAPTIILIHYNINAKRVKDLELLKKMLLTYLGVTLVGVGGFILYTAFLWRAFGDPLAFIHVQGAWGRSQGQNFITNLWEVYYSKTLSFSYFGGTYNYLIGLLSMYLPIVFLLFTFWWTYKNKRMLWLIPLTLFIIFLPLSTGIVTSANRYIYGIVPLFALASYFLTTRLRVLSAFIPFLASLLLGYIAFGFLAFRLFAG